MLIRWLLGLALVFGAMGAAHSDDAVQVPATTDLQALGELAERRGLPLLVVFTASHCRYCELLESAILRPMLISGDYDDRVIIRKLELDGPPIRDFQGRPMAASRYAGDREVFVTPTMLFVDGRGEEIARRLVGINTVEMYAGRVERSLTQASNNLAAQRIATPLAQASPPP